MPATILIWALIISTIIFGFLLRLFEGVISEASGQDYTNMTNCMWNVIITSSSVGYGELYPKTFFGRIVGVVICFWGIFTVSFFVVVVTQILDFSESEQKSYNLLLRLYHKSELKRDAVAVE